MTLPPLRAFWVASVVLRPIGAFASVISKMCDASIFKSWALSRCSSKAYPSAQAKADAKASAAAYLEFSTLSTEAFNEGGVLVDLFLSKSYGGSAPGPYNTLKCIDLFPSREFESLVKKHVRKF